MRLVRSLIYWAVLLPSVRPLQPRAHPLVPTLGPPGIATVIALATLAPTDTAHFMGATAGSVAAIVPTERESVLTLPKPRRPTTVMLTLIIVWRAVPNSLIAVVATGMSLAMTASEMLGVMLCSR